LFEVDGAFVDLTIRFVCIPHLEHAAVSHQSCVLAINNLANSCLSHLGRSAFFWRIEPGGSKYTLVSLAIVFSLCYGPDTKNSAVTFSTLV
jgi:hypothetical protein